ncbi:MAG: CPBP family intramembrane metalloprotease [Bacteroidetes bacterium]|nr:MAG: CPBP family intramembrane metalloprotease [Bacteroidota bacterium]
MKHFLLAGEKGRNDFFSHALTIALVVGTLAIFSMIPVWIYAIQTNQTQISTALLQKHFGSNLLFLFNLLPIALGLGTLWLCVRYIHKRKFVTLITIRKAPDLKRILFSFLIWMAFLFLFFVLNLFLSPEEISWNFQPAQFGILLLISLVFVSIQCLFEEIFFRGYLLQAFGSTIPNKWIPALLSCGIFTLMHFQNPEVELLGWGALLYYFATAIFLTWITVIDDGIELSSGFHIANNLFGALWLTNDWQVFQTDALFRSHAAAEINSFHWITILAVYPLLMYLYSKKYGLSPRKLFESYKHD